MESTIERTRTRPRFPFAQVIAFAVVLGILALFAIGFVNRTAQPLDRGPAPQFVITLYGGGNFSLAEQRGKVVVVNFWASWCIPCRDEAPMLERVWRKYKDRGVVFIGIDYVDTEKEALKFIQEYGMTYPNGPDVRTETSQKFRIKGVPETYFVGTDGQLYGNYIGPMDERTLVTKLEELLSK